MISDQGLSRYGGAALVRLRRSLIQRGVNVWVIAILPVVLIAGCREPDWASATIVNDADQGILVRVMLNHDSPDPYVISVLPDEAGAITRLWSELDDAPLVVMTEDCRELSVSRIKSHPFGLRVTSELEVSALTGPEIPRTTDDPREDPRCSGLASPIPSG